MKNYISKLGLLPAFLVCFVFGMGVVYAVSLVVALSPFACGVIQGLSFWGLYYFILPKITLPK